MCVRLCCAVHALWGIAYTAAGSVQLVAGIFFLLSLPILRLGSNICTGSCNVLIGVGTVMLSCFGDLNKRRCQKLLILTFLALAINVVNLVLLEVGEWYYFLTPETKEIITQHNHEELVFYARISTSLTTALVIVIAFVDTQLSYCSMQFKKDPRMRGGHMNETVSDIEYILPRHKPRPMSSKQSHILNQYSQSWVFDADTGTSSQNESPYLKLSPSAPMETISEKSSRRHYQASPLAQTPIVRVQVSSDDSTTTTTTTSVTTNRQLNHMSSFSRTPSPGVHHHQQQQQQQETIYDCLEKITRPNVYRNKLENYITDDLSRPGSSRSDYNRLVCSSDDTSQHASLMLELEQSFTHKKTSDTKRGSDAEFSKELEAALKLIQDLESPNTIETPSETCKTIPGTNLTYKIAKQDCDVALDCEDSGSSQTISGNDEAFDINGKKHLESQSTSGYNSPSPETSTPNNRTTFSIRYSGEKAIISITNNADCVNNNDDNNKVLEKSVCDVKMKKKFWKIWNNRKSTIIIPEVANAVVKSESLAFLTEKELEERLDSNKNLRRKIEERVIQEKSIRKVANEVSDDVSC